MTKLIILSLFTLISFGVFSQLFNNHSDVSVNECIGGVNIFNNGEFTLQFTGEKGKNSIKSYPSLESISSENQIWVSFIASVSGTINLKASNESGFLQMVIFKQLENSICNEIDRGVSEIERLSLSKEFSSVALSKEVSQSVMYPIRMEIGEKVSILFTTEEKSEAKMLLDWDFQPEIIVKTESKWLDKRIDDFAPTFSVTVRDLHTNNPLIANISIQDAKALDGLYYASDLFLNVERRCDMKIKCDVEGYFFKDSIIEASSFEDQEIIFHLQQISSGQSIKIEDIEFKPGSSEITLSSEPKLRRLKDFLLLNSDITIEIQGHVFEIGNNSFAGQKVSEARAKRIRKHLIDHGVDKSRLRAKGYGNSQPVFAEPKFSYEEQANRRVEILVL